MRNSTLAEPHCFLPKYAGIGGLALSGKAPLSICISYRYLFWDGYAAALLSPHLHRAGKLRITYAGKTKSSPVDDLFIDLRGKFKFLTDLHVDRNHRHHPPPHLDTFEHAPLLRNVFGQPQGFALPWSQIKHYRGKLARTDDAPLIFRQYPQLEYLSLSVYYPYTYQDYVVDLPGPIVSPCLLELRITDEIGTTDRLIPLLRTPLLEVIQISEISRGFPIPQALITSIAQSHCTQLTSLQLLCSAVDARELRQLAELVPELRELDMYFTSDAFRAFTYSSVAPNVFPHLARLIAHQVDMDNGDLIGVFRSWVSLGLHGTFEGSQVERLQYCQIYPCGEKGGGAGAVQRLQNAVDSSHDMSVERLKIMDSNERAPPHYRIRSPVQEDAGKGVEWTVQKDEHGWYTLVGLGSALRAVLKTCA